MQDPAKGMRPYAQADNLVQGSIGSKDGLLQALRLQNVLTALVVRLPALLPR